MTTDDPPRAEAEGEHGRVRATARYGAVDVHYTDGAGARAALVVTSDPSLGEVVAERLGRVEHAAPYEPGRFVDRELPPLRTVLAGTALTFLVVDGYVDLDSAGRPGLGRHVFAEYGFPVIGVAKSEFRGAAHARPVYRGGASRALFVTAAGMTVDEAASHVSRMAGPHRIPDALRRADRIARTGRAELARAAAAGE